MSNVPLPRPGPLGLIQYAGSDMQEYAAAVSAAKDAEIAGLRAELLKSLADNAALRKHNAALRKRVRELATQAMFNTSTIERLRAEAVSDRRCKQPDHCLNPAWCKTSSRCMRDSEPEVIRPTITRPEPDCRKCVNHAPRMGRVDCEYRDHCTNGDRYEPLPPVRLWRKP